MQKWSDDMKSYFKENWKGTNNEEISENEGIGSSKNQKEVVEDVFEDYLDISSFLTKNEVVNGNKNVLLEEGNEGFFNA